MTLGIYSNFPPNIHFIQNYLSTASTRQLQQRLITVLGEVNKREFRFEEVSVPTVPEGWVIFEFGLADGGNFTFIDQSEVEMALQVLDKTRVGELDCFCAIRYYRGCGEARAPLKFDYYMLRLVFGKGSLEVQVAHERGPRYLSPEDLVEFLVAEANKDSKRRMLREANL
ncbi:MAG: hypothetical protein NWE93_08765 [Candidatus Bathyarchaeota archaeon]|nr:hypothetical protein [Candidatus Bathyarchaeota archaeon]